MPGGPKVRLAFWWQARAGIEGLWNFRELITLENDRMNKCRALSVFGRNRCRSRREEAQILGCFSINQSLLTSAPTISKQSLKQSLRWVLALFVCSSILFAVVSGLAAEGPKLKFANATYDFDKIPAGQIIRHTFFFTNVGDQMLEIKD